MLDNASGRGLHGLSESDYLRLEAMQLFEQMLTDGDEAPLVAFIEQQIVHDPPRLELMQDIADDLQQRLLSLREYHFDVRERVVDTLSASYGVDLTPLTPPSALDRYHTLTPECVMSFIAASGVSLTDADVALLRKMIEASLHMAAQLYSDIQLAVRLHSLISDWISGMSATLARQQWAMHRPLDEGIPGDLRH